MGIYKSRTPKLTKLWSSSPNIFRFKIKAFSLQAFKEENGLQRDRTPRRRELPPCRNYEDGAGRKRFQGTASLKGTESGT